MYPNNLIIPSAPLMLSEHEYAKLDPSTDGPMPYHRQRTEKMWIDTYRRLNALWIGGPAPTPGLKPHGPLAGQKLGAHALLTSGLHSSMFFNSGKIAEFPLRLKEAARDLLLLMFHTHRGLRHGLPPERTVGCAMGAITLAHEVACSASDFAPWAGDAVRTSVAEKDGDGFAFKRSHPLPRERVLICEDVITTGGSVRKLLELVKSYGAEPYPFILALVNRSGLRAVDGHVILPLINYEAPTWDAKQCPWCDAGSKPVRPKENWSELQLLP